MPGGKSGTTSLWQVIRGFLAIPSTLQRIEMNQQDELNALDDLDTRLTAVQAGVLGLDGKISDLETALGQQGAFVPQAVADKLAALKAHISTIATSLGIAPAPADSPVAASDSPSAPSPTAVGAHATTPPTGTEPAPTPLSTGTNAGTVGSDEPNA